MSEEETDNLPEHRMHPHWYREHGIWYLRGAARYFKDATIPMTTRKGVQMVNLSDFQEVCRYKAKEPMGPRQIQPYVFSAVVLTSKRNISCSLKT